MDKPLTIKELYERCKEEIKAGRGDNVVMLSDDDEGNGYHYCWYAFTPATDMDSIDCYGLIKDIAPAEKTSILG